MICFLFIVTSCSQSEEGKLEDVKIPVNDIEETEVLKTLETTLETFHFVADWLSDSEIVYVSKENDLYIVNTFNILTGEHTVIYEDSAIIVDVLVHNSKNALLLHTTNSPTAAEVKIIALDGTIMNDVSIASSEIKIEWNDINPALVLLTAFEEDWTYHVHLYNGEEDDLKPIALPDPFPKWLDVEHIALIDQTARSSEGDELLLYNSKTNEIEATGVYTEAYFDTYEDALLTVQMTEDLQMDYSIINVDKKVLSSWSMPAVQNYSEWVLPEIHWKSTHSILMAATESDEQLDQAETPFKLYEVVEGKEDVSLEEVATNTLRCSPDGDKCLTGYGYEALIDMVSKETTAWISFQE